ncbi:nitrite reductase [Lysinibacillus contaminans]|uniref:Nitrite reductase n=1 Tax=Lysinibacillus contaminans TaxID=1293441 RepID=A0ABR5K2J1_9BACI|nr:nitrite reductase [Lysinibacillus contaminans]KOS68564.1 nitrite reductase [Lysinibacillus contaminans]
MSEIEKKIKLAVNGGIGFGSKLNAKQLVFLAEYLGDQELELTTFQQLYIEAAENDVEFITKKFNEVGLSVYPVGNYVKSLRHCNFCKGEEQEGMPVAKEINRRIAGKPVPFTLRPAYAGCPIGCGEPLVNDIGVLKVKNGFDLYIGGNPKGAEARVGKLVKAQLQPDELYSLIDKILVVYIKHGKKRESFFKFLNRYGFDTLPEQVLITERL